MKSNAFTKFGPLACVASALFVLATASPAWAQQEGDQANKAEATQPDASSTGQPVFKCDEPSFDFGEFWSGPAVSHTFEIKNTGTAPLMITNVKPSCGCTLAGAYTKEVPPGGTGTIPCSLKTTAVHDNFTKTIRVDTNDPESSSVTLKLTGTAKAKIEVEPKNVMFGQVKYDDEMSRTVRITNNFDQPITIAMDDDSRKGQFNAELREVTPGQEYELVVSGVRPFQQGLNRGIFRLKSNLEDVGIITIQAMANLPPRLQLSKTQILIPKAQDTELTHTVLVTNHGEAPVKVVSAEVEGNSDIKTSVTERADGKINQVAVTFPANYLPPTGGTKLVINTNDAETKTLEVPVLQSPARPTAPSASRKRPIQELVGQNAPDVEITSINGSTLDTSNPDGKVMILDFVTSWCPHCKKQSPKVNEVYEAFKDNPKVQFALVSQDSKTGRRAATPETVISKFKEAGVDFDLYIDYEKKAGTPFKATSYPSLVVLGPDGTVEAVHSGNTPTLKDDLTEQINALLAGKKIADRKEGTAKAGARKAEAVKSGLIAPVKPTKEKSQ